MFFASALYPELGNSDVNLLSGHIDELHRASRLAIISLINTEDRQ